MHACNLSERERLNRYEDTINFDIIYLYLNESEIDEIVACLQEAVISKNQDSGSLVSAMGYTSAKSGLLPLITTIEQCVYDFNTDELNQALIALEKLLFFEESLSFSQKKTMLLAHAKFLNRLSHKILSDITISSSNPTSTYIRVVSRIIILIFDEN